MSARAPFSIRDGRPDDDPEFGPLLFAIDGACGTLLAAYREADRLAVHRAALYIAGAEGSLRIAAAAAASAWYRMTDNDPPGTGALSLGGSAFALRATCARLIGDRHRIVTTDAGVLLEAADGADDAPTPPGRSLAADVVRSRAIRRLARGPLFGGLLEDALARHDWWCATAGVRWMADPGAAGAVVDAASGGRWRVRLGPRDAGGLVDREIAGLLSSIGWRPMALVGLPGDDRSA